MVVISARGKCFGLECSVAVALLSGEVQDHVLAKLYDDTPRMLAEWAGLLVGLAHARGKGSAETLLELRLGEQEIVEGLHVLYSRIAESVKQPMTGLPGIAKWQSCYVAADVFLREWPGPVRITWTPYDKPRPEKATMIAAARDAKNLAGEAPKVALGDGSRLPEDWLKLVLLDVMTSRCSFERERFLSRLRATLARPSVGV